MAPTVPTVEPTRLTAGDTWQWRRRFTAYPISEGWGLSYAINGVEALPWESSWVTNDGTQFTVLVPADKTELPPGRYEWSAILTGSGAYVDQRKVACRGVLVIDANPEVQADGDRQAWCEKMLGVVESLLVGQVPTGIQAYSLGGRSVQFMEPMELRKWRGQLRTELFRLRNPGRDLPGMRTTFTLAGQ